MALHDGRRDPRPLVLVVDDEPGIVEFLGFALEDNGYRVVTARDGVDALALIARELPDFVLTDLMMPRLDGWEFCRRLRDDSAARALPVIGMSAVDARQAPLDAFLRKPFELDDLLDTLHRLARDTGHRDGDPAGITARAEASPRGEDRGSGHARYRHPGR